MKKQLLPLLLLLGMFAQNLFSQTPTCPSPPPPGAESCAQACVSCDLDGYRGSNNGTPSGGNTVCGAIAVHNDQWFGFVAGTSSITFNIVTTNCQDGNGLQAAFFESCDAPDALVCNPGSAGGAEIPLILAHENFVVGQVYYLMIDGWSGDVCDFEIDVVSGSVISGAAANAPQPQGPAQTCSGSEQVYTIPEVANASSYTWTAPPGAKINGGGPVLTLPAPQGTGVVVTFGNISGNVCVQAQNACYPASAQACLPVTVGLIPQPHIFPPAVVCSGNTPYVLPWGDSVYTSGLYIKTLPSATSDCDSVLQQQVTVKSPIIKDFGTVLVCANECFQLGDSLLCAPGDYTQTFDAGDGCDSVVVVKIAAFNSNAAAFTAPLGQTITCENPVIVIQAANIPNVQHLWKKIAGDTIAIGNSVSISEPGIYVHVATSTTGNQGCSASRKVLVKSNNTPPPVTAQGGTITPQQPTVQLMASSVITNLLYHWTGPNGFESWERNPFVSVPGTYNLVVTNTQTGCSNMVSVVVN